MTIKEYRKKRRFDVTPEPSGSEPKTAGSAVQSPPKAPAASPAKGPAARKPQSSLRYVIQKHRATQLHYDFRLEWNGVLLSWAIPKGPSLDPSVKRLAAQVEDHPLEYGGFEGVIPEGEYGGGTVMLWDQGTWTPEDPDVDAALRKGELKFKLNGKKLKGSWVLVRTKGGFGGSRKPQWLLIKHRDQYASVEDVLAKKPRSVSSNRLMSDIARDSGGDVAKAAKADPPRTPRSRAS